MGHITRDVGIAREIHKQLPEVELVWLASPMAAQVLDEIGEKLLPESSQSADYSESIDKIVDGYGLDLVKYVRYGKRPWEENVQFFRDITNKYDFNLVIGDEIYELLLAIVEGRLHTTCPVVVIQDFIACVAMSSNPLERILVSILNRKTVRNLENSSLTHFFVGKLVDIPDQRAGFFYRIGLHWPENM